MAKAKEEQPKVEAAKVEEATVSVEMSEAQKKDFTDFMAKKEAEAEEAKPEDKIEVELKFGHQVNNNPYGPGRVVVPESLGYGLLERDQAAIKARLAVHESNKFMIEILSSGKSVVRKVTE